MRGSRDLTKFKLDLVVLVFNTNRYLGSAFICEKLMFRGATSKWEKCTPASAMDLPPIMNVPFLR